MSGERNPNAGSTGGSALGDLIRSLRQLDIRSADEALAVARMLGLGDAAAGREAAGRDAGELAAAEPPAAAPQPPDTPPDRRPDNPDASATASSAQALLHSHQPHRLLLRRRGGAVTRPAWLDDARLGPLAPPAADPVTMPLPPLFDPRRLRAMLVTLCDRWVPGDGIDTEALSRLVVAGQPIHAVPRLRCRSLRHGVVILLDHRDGMAPYRLDQAALVAQARSLMPDEHVQVLVFEGTPLRGRPLRGGTAEPLLLGLSRDSPVLVLSDLSISGPVVERERATAAEWEDALATARRRHLRLRLLVPYVRARWPLALQQQQQPALLEWARGTTLSDLRRAVAAAP